MTDVGLGLTEVELREGLSTCLGVPRWVDDVLAHAPYGSVAALLRVARAAAHPLSSPEIDQALRRHPRLTDRVSGHGPGTSFATVDHGDGSEDAAVTAELTAACQAYEERFGRIFLIRAAGRTRAALLGEVQRRLENEPDQELREVERELRDIALLRIPQLFPHLDHHSGYDDSEAAR